MDVVAIQTERVKTLKEEADNLFQEYKEAKRIQEQKWIVFTKKLKEAREAEDFLLKMERVSIPRKEN